MPKSNELQANELEWLWASLARFIRRSTARLDNEDAQAADVQAILKVHIEEVSLYGRLISGKRVLPEDRVSLLLTLLDERKRLLTNFETEGREERTEEADFIDGFLRHLSEVDWEGLGLPDMPYKSRGNLGRL